MLVGGEEGPLFGSLVVDPSCWDLFGDTSVIGVGYFDDELELSYCDDAWDGMDVVVVELFAPCFVFDTLFLDL